MTNEEFIKSISLEGEIWKDVVGYEGRNFVSSFGRMITIRTYNYRHKGKVIIRELMKPHIAKDIRYEKVSLYKNGKRKTESVHRIVAQAFIPNPNNYLEIDHINANRTDNRVENLKWCSHKENMNNPNALLSNAQARKGKPTSRSSAIVQLKNNEVIAIYDFIFLAVEQGFDASGIAHALSGRYSTHKGFQWMRLSDYQDLISMSKNS